jgi:hypothetical protein
MFIVHIYLETKYKSFNVEELHTKFLWASETGKWNWVVTLTIKLTVENAIILEFCYISDFISTFCAIY